MEVFPGAFQEAVVEVFPAFPGAFPEEACPASLHLKQEVEVFLRTFLGVVKAFPGGILGAFQKVVVFPALPEVEALLEELWEALLATSPAVQVVAQV